MMRTYVQLPDGTRLGYGEPLPDGGTKVMAVRLEEGAFPWRKGAFPRGAGCGRRGSARRSWRRCPNCLPATRR